MRRAAPSRGSSRPARATGARPSRTRPLAVADEDRDADAGRLDRQLRQAQDLPRLLSELRLLVELLADELPVHREVGLHRLDGPQALDSGVACSRHRLVRREPHPPQPCSVVERLEDAGKLDRRTVRVGDDRPAVDRVVVHAGDDERDALREPEGVRLVDAGRPGVRGRRDELRARTGTDGEEAEVEPVPGQPLRRGFLDAQRAVRVPHVRAGRPGDAYARMSANPRSASSSSVTVPTTPVAPTTPTRASVVGTNGLLGIELEGAVQRAHRVLDPVAVDETGDLDRRGVHDLGLDPELPEGRERPAGDAGMRLHSGADDADLAEVAARRPRDAEPVERRGGVRRVRDRPGKDDLRAGLKDGVDAEPRFGERLEQL